MGQDQVSSEYRSGVLVVGENKDRRVGGNGHVMVVRVNSGNDEEEENVYSVVGEEKGVCSDYILDVILIEDSVVTLCSEYVGLFLYDYSRNKILKEFPESKAYATFLPSKSLLISKDRSLQILLSRIHSDDNFGNSSLVSSFKSGHTKQIFSLFSNDSVDPNHAFSGSDDKTVRIHDLTTEQMISELTGHEGCVNAITCNPTDGNVIVSGSNSHTQSCNFWDFRSNALIQSLDTNLICSLLWTDFEPNLVLIGTERKGIQIFDIRNMSSENSNLMQLETGAGFHFLASIDENRFGVSSYWTPNSRNSRKFGKCQVFDYNSTEECLFETNLFGHSRGCCCYCPPFEDVSSLNLEQRAAKYFVPADKVTRGKLINRGGQGVVYKGTFAISPISSLDVAIKRFVVSRNLTEEQQQSGMCAADDLEHEIKLMTELNHENILECHGCFFDEDDGDPDAPTVNVILEWCGDGDLNHWLRSEGPDLTLLERLDVYLQVAKGMLHMHEANIVHSDLGLENVLVTSIVVEGSIRWIMKVCDFGLSNHFGSVISALDVGKPRYIAPTRSGDRNKIDVYSFGIMGYEIWLNGKHAYAKEYKQWGMRLSAADKLSRIRSFGLRPNLRECKGMPTALKDLLTVCWSEDPDDRPSFDQIVADLEEIIQNPVVEEEEEEGENVVVVADSTNVEFWTVEQVSQHFSRLFGEEIGRILSENSINGSQVLDLSGRQLRRLGIEDVAIRRRMADEITRMDDVV